MPYIGGLTKPLQKFSHLAAIFIATVGLLVIFTSYAKFPLMRNFFPKLIEMKFNAALLFVLSGASLWYLREGSMSEKSVRIAKILAGAVVAIAFITFIQYPLHINLGIDTLLFYEPPGLPGTSHAGRMDITACLLFCMLGLCLILLDSKNNGWQKLSECFISASLTVSLFYLAAYCYRTDLYIIIPTPVMALHSAICFMMLSIGVFTARPRTGIMAVFAGDGPAGVMVRRFLPSAIFIPLICGYLILKSEDLIDYDFRFGLIIMAMISIISFSMLVIWNARSTHEIDLERKNVIRELRKAKEAAEAGTRAKSDFLASMSHEIRTPMNAVIGLANILMRSSPLTDKQREFISTLQLSANSLMSLINDLLDISRIEASNIQIENIDFDIINMVEEVITMMRVRANEKKIGLESEVNIQNGNYIGDPLRIRQILINLIGNAVKFTAEGKVVVKIEAVASGVPTMDNLKITVIDSGIGIAREKLAAIFEKFTQGDASTTRKFGGTGLGLAISKGLTELMGGRISVTSTPGQGSEFTITLPLKKGAKPIEKPAQPVPEKIQVKPDDSIFRTVPKVLLVEDYTANILVAGTMLTNFGYEYDTAGTGIAAIEKIKSYKYDLVLMDIQMPEMDGLTATREIRKLEKQNSLPPLPIIGMTAHALLGDREKCLATGMDDYISKPFNPHDLEDKLRKYIKTDYPEIHAEPGVANNYFH